MKQLGRYRIIKELGRGGMGVVYQAYDPNLKRHVALKIIGQALVDEKQKKRFWREANLMARMDHPNIVKIFDIGEEQGQCYFTMELLQGKNLRDTLNDYIPLAQLIHLLAVISQAVHYAHKQGVIHRDLKPSNIMITQEHGPKVMDFGLAQDVKKSDPLSRTVESIGTPEYMSPEQAEGKQKNVDAQSDVYSLGAILYEMLTDRPPFTGDNPMNVLYQIALEEPIAPCRISSGIPRELESICLKSIEKEKRKRYETALAFSEDLVRYLEGKPVLARPVTPMLRAWKWASRHRWLFATTSFLALALCSLLFLYIVHLNQTAAKETSLRKEIEKTAKLLETNAGLLKQRESEARSGAIAALRSQAEMELSSVRLSLDKRDYEQAMKRQKGGRETVRKQDEIARTMQEESSDIQKWTNEWEMAFRDIEKYCIAPATHRPESIYRTGMTMGLFEDASDVPFNALYSQGYTFASCSQVSRKYAALYGENRLVVWDIVNRKEVRSLSVALRKNFRSAAFSPDDRWFAWGDMEGNFSLWEIGSEKVITRRIEAESRAHAGILLLEFSPDMKWLFVATHQKMALYDLSSLERFELLKNQPNPLCSFSKKGKWLAIRKDLSILFFDLEEIRKSIEPKHTVMLYGMALCFGPEDESLILGSVHDIQVFPLDTLFAKQRQSSILDQEKRVLLEAHRGDILSLEVSEDGNFLASLGRDNRLVLWNAYTYAKIFEIKIRGNIHDYSSLRFRPDGRELSVWSSSCLETYRCMPLFSNRLALEHPDFSKQTLNLVRHLRRNINAWRMGSDRAGISMNPTGNSLAYYVLSDLYLWDIRQNKLSLLLKTYEYCKRMEFSQDGMFFLWCSRNIVKIIRASDGKEVRFPSDMSQTEISGLCFCPESDWLVTDVDQRLQFWKIEGEEAVLRKKVEMGHGGVFYKAFDATGKRMAISNGPFCVEVWQRGNEFERLASCSIETQSAVKRTVCFFSDNLLSIGDGSGDLFFHDWRADKAVHKLSLYDPIEWIWYDPEKKLHWIRTKTGLFLYRYFEDPSVREKMELVYPLPIFPGHPIIAVDIDPGFKTMALLLQSGEIWVYPGFPRGEK